MKLVKSENDRVKIKTTGHGGLNSTEVANLLLTQQPQVPSIPEFFSVEKISMLLRLINFPGYRKVDSGLKTLIEPI